MRRSRSHVGASRLPLRVAVVVCTISGSACGGRENGETVRVTVPAGSSVGAVAESLATRGVIGSPRMFRFYTRVTSRDRSIRAGTYDFTTGMSMSEALHVLVAGVPAMEALVLPEGLMLTEVADFAESQLGIPRDSFLEAASDSTLRRRVGARGPTLEGYLYPSTYMVRVGATADEIVQQMINEFDANWKPEWRLRLDSLSLTRDELITLASIIEGEARHPEDRVYVSSVYHNRLIRGMRLQADPTVIYALGRRRRLFERDYQIQSPYNTYRIDGLPPSPIGQPSAASIEAALYPRESDFLYFVAGPDGRHIFSRTYREHLATIRRVRSVPNSS